VSGFTANHRPKKNLSEPNPSLFDDMFPDRLLDLITSERHRQYVERLKLLVNDWQQEFPDQEWL
jgi:hypothetical protein